jgi:hypothetical protein
MLISCDIQFSRIFVVALPERSDKRDAISMSASLTGVKFDWVDGVNGDLIPEKAVPQVRKLITACQSIRASQCECSQEYNISADASNRDGGRKKLLTHWVVGEHT